MIINTVKIRQILLAILVISAPLSFVPSLALPVLNFPSFRIGLYQITALFFIIFTIKPLYRALPKLFGLNKIAYISLAVIALTALISQIFSSNPNRGALLTLSLIFLLFVVFSAWYVVAFEIKNITYVFIKAYLISAIIIAILGILQLIWGTYYNDGGFLCKGCTNAVFGFPRINITSAEPLFLANALLPVLLVSFYLSLKANRLALISLFASTLTIGLTFARGGYLSATLAIIVLSGLLYINKKTDLKTLAKPIILMLFAGLLSLVLLLISATAKFSSTTPNITYNTLRSMVSHLSLGVVELPQKSVISPETTNNNPSDDFESPGLIEASTNERLDSAELAITAWQDNIKNFFIGTGLGSLGAYVVANINPSAPSNLTVYIFYILLLAELGLFGFIAFITLLTNLIYQLYQKSAKHAHLAVCLSILIAFMAQYFFLGSYINVVYIWLWIGIFLGLLANHNIDFKGIIPKGKQLK